jgi:hypothetical protein
MKPKTGISLIGLTEPKIAENNHQKRLARAFFDGSRNSQKGSLGFSEKAKTPHPCP